MGPHFSGQSAHRVKSSFSRRLMVVALIMFCAADVVIMSQLSMDWYKDEPLLVRFRMPSMHSSNFIYITLCV